MTGDIISKATRKEFREVLVGNTLREIGDIFDIADLKPNLLHDSGMSGQRRTLVEQYYSALNFKSPADMRRLARAYEEVIEQLERAKKTSQDPSQYLQPTIDALLSRMARDGFNFQGARFVSDKLRGGAVSSARLLSLSQESLDEQITKVDEKIDDGDFAGAITNAYSLLETFLKLLLRRLKIAFNENEGDVRKLYSVLATPLKLSPGGENVETVFKPILQGFQSQVGGLYEVANKLSDRHARKYNPAKPYRWAERSAVC